MAHARPLIILAFALLPLIGCGGGGTSPDGGTGRATLTIVWPDRSKLIPRASNSIEVSFTRGTQIIATQLLPRPVSGYQTQTTFNDLKTGRLILTASAFPNSDGTGVAQASGASGLTIFSGQTTVITLTIFSTVTTLSLIAPSLVVGQHGQMQVTARDQSSAVVILAPSQLQWSSSDTSIITIDGSGQVTAVAAGVANISVLDTESGKSASIPVGVAPANTVLNPANGHYYASVELPDLITWQSAKSAAALLTYNGWKGHLVTITSASEDAFVQAHFTGTAQLSYLLGGYQDTSAPDYSEPAGGWRWVTGEPWVYTNWGAGEPNNLGNAENILNKFPWGGWNDTLNNDGHAYGYIVEFEP